MHTHQAESLVNLYCELRWPNFDQRIENRRVARDVDCQRSGFGGVITHSEGEFYETPLDMLGRRCCYSQSSSAASKPDPVVDAGIPPISRALQARNDNYTHLGSAESEIRPQFEIHTYLGSAEPEIRISGLQSPR
ncbi:hypothetical protein PIB30_090559 [Stylosanthes scabra]|uniref:Uncharacterized protein n=1 Tax=Stylosanthes scabra TaxID=79078 RepID=A0ABU6UWM9_9FABA|nr:hypothetical protein [Stylosanthes scabra]